MSLVTAIDELLVFVQDKRPPECFVLRGELLTRFEELDCKVWVEACRSGFENKLPQRAAVSGWEYLGKTHLPGKVYGGFRVAPAYVIRTWRNELLALRDLAALNSDRGGVGQSDEYGQPGKGRRKSRFDWENDKKIAEDWQQAKSAGTKKKEFAKDKKLKMIQLNRILNRHAKRTARKQKPVKT
jgi:hypothetical protein